MKTAKEHYDTHLAAIYDWMAGGFENAVVRNNAFFDRLKLAEVPRGLAIDLGAGSGFQSIPLAWLGFQVVAVDFSAPLLGKLKRRTRFVPVRIVEDDILNFPRHIDVKAQMIVCMGDTLTHLKSFEEVRQLLLKAEQSLN